MSFTSDIKGEIIRGGAAALSGECCARALVMAAVLNTPALSVRGMGRYSLSISLEHQPTIEYIYEVVSAYCGVTPSIQTVLTSVLGGRERLRLNFDEPQSAAVLDWLGLLSPSAPFGVRSVPPSGALRRACCRRAYIRGAFLACGHMNPPERKCHLEFVTPDERRSDALARTLMKCGVPPKTAVRRHNHIVYLKDAEGVSELLGIMGAHAALLKFEEALVEKQMRGSINRQVNCDTGNAELMVDAAIRQVEDINLIIERGGQDSLPDSLRELAELRLENQEVSLSELGEMLDPPLSKSGVNNRMRRIAALANKLRETETREEIL